MSVTILVPVYGVEKYIAECAHSLFRQTYKEIEYVFCDDCTPDRSMEVLKEVVEQYPERKAHVRIISNESNMGIGGTRSHLVSEVKTEYFTFVDSDDMLTEGAIEFLVGKMRNEDTDIVEGVFCYFSKRTRGEINLPSHDTSDLYRRKVQVCDLLRHQVWGRLYKTSVLKQLPDMFVEGIDMAEDYCAMTRLAALTSRSWTDEVVYLYRVDEQSFFIKEMSEKNIRSYLKATKVVYDFYRNREPLPLSVEIGIIRAYRQVFREKSMTIEMVDEVVGYTPEHSLAKILQRVMRSRYIPFGVKNVLYKSVRAYSLFYSC